MTGLNFSPCSLHHPSQAGGFLTLPHLCAEFPEIFMPNVQHVKRAKCLLAFACLEWSPSCSRQKSAPPQPFQWVLCCSSPRTKIWPLLPPPATLDISCSPSLSLLSWLAGHMKLNLAYFFLVPICLCLVSQWLSICLPCCVSSQEEWKVNGDKS